MLKYAVEVLVMHRISANVLGLLRTQAPEVWSVITGGVENGEMLIEAARREVFEETGLDTYSIIDLGESYKFVSPSGETVEIHDFGLITDCVEISLNSEHSQYEWLTIDELLQRIPFSQQRDRLEKAYTRLSNNARET